MPQTPVRHVIFDFGGVLLKWQPQEILRSFYDDEPLRELISQTVFRHQDWLEMDRGTLDEESAVRRFAQRAGRPSEEMVALLRHVKDSLTPIPETVGIIEDLASREIPLFGLSNMSAPTFDHLRRRYALWGLFRGIVISGEVKMMKPEPEIFHHLAQRYALTIPETVFIDDSPQNIEGAARLGFQTFLFKDATQCAAELNRLLSA
jgi:putative hydrolase of the HAD superfamily